jgi:hypothetical protein
LFWFDAFVAGSRSTSIWISLALTLYLLPQLQLLLPPQISFTGLLQQHPRLFQLLLPLPLPLLCTRL